MSRDFRLVFLCTGNNRIRYITAMSIDDAIEKYMEKYGSYPQTVVVSANKPTD